MIPEIFCLAEASAIKQGSFSILHTFNDAFAPEFPAGVVCVVCLQLRITQDEEGKHRMRFILVDSDGHTVWESGETEFKVQFISIKGASMNFTSNTLLSASLEQGNYELKCLVDDREIGSIPLGMNLIKK